MPSIDKGAAEATDTGRKSGPGATPGTPEKDPKDKPETGAVGEDPAKEMEKKTPPPHKQPHTENIIHNRDQDPNHPANTTQSRRGDPSPRPVAEGIHVDPAEMRTEQEKEAAGSGGDPRAGVGPYNPSRSTTGPAKTIEDEGIAPRTPYPTGNPPPPDVASSLGQGIWKGDENEDQDGPNSLPERQKRDVRSQSEKDAFRDGTTKDDYHTGDTIVDGPNQEHAKRMKLKSRQGQQQDPRPQQRIGGPQEMATPPKENA